MRWGHRWWRRSYRATASVSRRCSIRKISYSVSTARRVCRRALLWISVVYSWKKSWDHGTGSSRSSWPSSSACWLCQRLTESARLRIGLCTVPYDLTLHRINHIFSDVRRQVANAFQMARYRQGVHETLDLVGMLPHLLLYPHVHRLIELIHLAVSHTYFTRQSSVALHHGVQALFHHLLDFLGHVSEAGRQIDLRMTGQILCTARNINGRIGHALEIVIHLQDGYHKAQVNGHRLVQSENLKAILLDLDLHLIDFVIAFSHLLRERGIALDHGRDRLRNTLFDHGTHRQNFFLEGFDFTQKMLRHMLFSCAVQAALSRSWLGKNAQENIDCMTASRAIRIFR